MVWLIIKAVLCVMCIVSVSGKVVAIEMMCIKWSGSVHVHVRLLSNSFLCICLIILDLSSVPCLIFMWSQFMMSVWLVLINFTMMDWTVLWSVWVVLMVVIVVFNEVWGHVVVMMWVNSMMDIFMSVESGSMTIIVPVVWCFVVWCFMVCISKMSMAFLEVSEGMMWCMYVSMTVQHISVMSGMSWAQVSVIVLLCSSNRGY